MIDKLFVPLASALVLAIFLLANAVLQPALSTARIDFTDEGQFTLSAGTVSILEGLAEPVAITFVYTRSVGQDYPAVRAYAQRVRELLESYESLGGARIRLLEIDPTPFSIDEDEALAAGITSVETDGTDPLYFGLIGRNAVDDELVIPFLAPEREATLEYDLTRLIARLDKPEPETIGIISDLPNMSGTGESSGYFVLQEMAAIYQIQPISEGFTNIPEDIDVLLLAHAASLNTWQTYLIDQFILEKGRAVFLVDPASTVAEAGGVFNVGKQRTRSDLGTLGKAWGVSLSEDAVADIQNALQVNISADGRTINVDQPLFLGLPPTNMAGNDPITSPLSLTINMGAPGALSISTDSPLSFKPLIQTGATPSFIAPENARRGATPQDIIKLYESQNAPFTLAARLSGNLKTAFPSGPPAVESLDPVEAELERITGQAVGTHRTSSNTPAEILIIADTDMLDDSFYLDPRASSPQADNATLILNALDNLTGGSALLNLRSRKPNLRPMTRVEDMRSSAQEKFFDEQARLESRLALSQGRLEELQAVGATGGFFSGDIEADLTTEERAELADLRQSVVDTRESLRLIERDFRSEIDALETRLRFINIWGGPLLVMLIGFLMWAMKKRGTS